MFGYTHNVRAARERCIVEACAQPDLEVLADKDYTGTSGTVITPIKRRLNTELPGKQKKPNKVHAALRVSVEQTISRIKQWGIFRRARTSPNRLTSFAAAIPAL
ncbi:transposase family protein [Streptomyces olivoreticuli]|uniref:transposase family protein n=1 Tax=Streptomyces olivoreticuli TaxID=68246 RepID=UPI003CC7F222